MDMITIREKMYLEGKRDHVNQMLASFQDQRIDDATLHSVRVLLLRFLNEQKASGCLSDGWDFKIYPTGERSFEVVFTAPPIVAKIDLGEK